MHGLIFETSICYWQDQPDIFPTSSMGVKGVEMLPKPSSSPPCFSSQLSVLSRLDSDIRLSFLSGNCATSQVRTRRSHGHHDPLRLDTASEYTSQLSLTPENLRRRPTPHGRTTPYIGKSCTAQPCYLSPGTKVKTTYDFEF